jgi:ubiquitin-like protein Pup
MAKQERIQKPRVVVDRNTRTEVMADSRTKRSADKLRAELDEMLDEIDDILEENGNAQEFVAGYRQKGGE